MATLCIAGYVYLFAIIFALVFQNGLSRGDDALNATAAKNLAFGYGYSTSLDHNYPYGVTGIVPFSWAIQTGPVLILPAAVFIGIFGNEFWVPGLVTAVAAALFLIAIGLTQLQWAPPLAFAYMLLLVFLLYLVTLPLFHQWYVLMGEIPAALLCILAASIFVGASKPGPSRVALASFLFGLAVMTKYLAVLGYFPLLLWLFIDVITGKSSIGKAAGLALISIVCLLIPFSLFELWSAIELGSVRYVERWATFFPTFVALSGAGSFGDEILYRVVSYSSLFQKVFGVPLWGIVASSSGVAIVMVIVSRVRPAASLALFLYIGCMIHLTWWTFISQRNEPRYVLIGLILYCASAATVAYARPNAVALGLSLLIISSQPIQSERIKESAKTLYYGFQENDRLIYLRQLAAFLEARTDERPFVASWWPTVADIEYAMKTLVNFRAYSFIQPSDAGRDWLLVRNRTWALPLPGFAKWEDNCKEVLFEKGPYLVSRCPSQRKQLEYLRRLTPQNGSAQGTLRVDGGRLELSMYAPSIFQLRLKPGEMGEIKIGFGVDPDQPPGFTVCFFVKAVEVSGLATELLRECLDPNSGKLSEQVRSITLPEARSLDFVTQSPGPKSVYWTELTITHGEAAAPEP